MVKGFNFNFNIHLISILKQDKILLGSESLPQSFRNITVVDPFEANVPFLYHLKTPENQKFPDVFRGFRNGTLA